MRHKSQTIVAVSVLIAVIVVGGIFFTYKISGDKTQAEKQPLNTSIETGHHFDSIGLTLSYPSTFALEIPKEQEANFTLEGVLSSSETDKKQRKLKIISFAAGDTSVEQLISDAALEYAKNPDITIKEQGVLLISDQQGSYILYEIRKDGKSLIIKELFLKRGEKMVEIVFSEETDTYDSETADASKEMLSYISLEKIAPKVEEVAPVKATQEKKPAAVNTIKPTEKKDVKVATESLPLDTAYYTAKDMPIKFLPVKGWEVTESTSTDTLDRSSVEIGIYPKADPETDTRVAGVNILYIPKNTAYDEALKQGYSLDDMANEAINTNKEDMNYYEVTSFKKVHLAGKEMYYIDAKYIRESGIPARTTDYLLIGPETIVISIFSNKNIEDSTYPALEKLLNSIVFIQ